MDRSSYSSGKKTWIVACARCEQFKGFCKCTDANIIITNVSDAPISAFGAENPNWVANMLTGPSISRSVTRVYQIGGDVRSSFNAANSIGISEGVVRPPDQDSDE